MFFMLGLSAACGMIGLVLSLREGNLLGAVHSVVQACAPLSVLVAFFRGSSISIHALTTLGDWTLAVSLITFILSVRRPRNALYVHVGILGVLSYSVSVFLLHNLP
jgi:hypothetical protein